MSATFPSGTFNFVDLMAKDIARMREFYGSLFGWTYEEQQTHGPLPYGMFLKDGQLVAGIGQMSPDMIEQGVPSTWNSYIAVDDIAGTEAKIKALGGSLMFETMTIPGAGKTNWARDPEEAVFALWQAEGHGGSALYNKPGSFCWNERATRNLDGVKTFYGPLFGWTFKDEMAPTGSQISMIHNAEGREIAHAIVMTEMWGPMPAHWSVYFAVESCDGTIGKAKSLGGKPFMDTPIDIPAGRFSLLSDPDGAPFYVIELAEDAA